MSKMIKTISVNKLEVGMYVNLPLSWMSHSFIKNKFLITSRKQIDKIVESGLIDVEIDTTLGNDPDSDLSVPGTSQDQFSIILSEIIHNPDIPPEKKAKAVQHYSKVIVKNLLDNPSAENIERVIKTVSEIVDLIITDNKTSFHLLNITTHDYATYIHSVNVGILSVSLAKVLYRHSDGHDMHALGAGFFLHDLGKVRIDHSIINKPGKLTDQEWKDMRRHPDFGFQILDETDKLSKESNIIVLQHHERNDGSGYPAGLKGGDIHPYGRICSVADVYDALTSVRPYKPRIAPFEALRLMQKEMLNHFQRDVFERFVLMLSSPEKT
jgi:HD-GYP domain-containing protein (c-di-GMP phosphodiesterase class II)